MSVPTPAVQSRLIRAAQAGDDSALEDIVTAFRPYVRAAVRNAAQMRVVPIEDLVQEGLLALVEVARTGDPDVPLQRQANRPIQHAAQAAIARHLGTSAPTYRRVIAAFRASNGDRVAARDYACSPERGGQRITEATWDAIQDGLRDTTPEHDVNLPGSSGGSVDPATIALMEAVSSASHVLTDRERTVLEMHYGLDGEPMTDGAIAASFGVDRSRIVRVRNRAIERLREEISSHGLTLKS